jgi:hypothetical protein
MILYRRGFGVERALVLLFGGLTVFNYFNMGFYIDSGITTFGFLLNLGYNGVVFSNCRDLLKQAIT